jgi:hypothetical protein
MSGGPIWPSPRVARIFARMSNTSAPSSSPTGSSQSDISALLDELACSGQSTASFARAHGLPPWKLYQALRQRQRKAQRSVKAPVTVLGDLVAVHLAPASVASAPIELVTAGGLRLRVPPDFDEVHLRRLLGALVGC